MASGDDYGVQSPNFGYLTSLPTSSLDRFSPVYSRQTNVKSTRLGFQRDRNFQFGDEAVFYFAETRADSVGMVDIAEIRDVSRGNKQRIQYTSANARGRASGVFNENVIEGNLTNLNFNGDQDGLEVLSVLFGISGGVGSLLEPEGATYQRDTNIVFQNVGGQGAAIPLVRTDTQTLFLPSRGQANRHVLVDEVQYAVIFRLRASVTDPAQDVPTLLRFPDIAFDFWTHISTPIFF